MRVVNLRINGINNPIGFRFDHLSCSWQVTEAKDQSQAMAKIEISLSADFNELLYQKEGSTLKSSGEPIELDLQSRTRYYYQVTVIGEGGETAVSEAAFFETGKCQEGFAADWIAASANDQRHPVFQKKFLVKKAVKRARLYAAGVGLFEASLNKMKLGAEYLTPYLSAYEKAIQVITFPVELAEGENTIEIMTGKGWYMGTFGLENKKENYGNKMAAIAELCIEYQDHSCEWIKTDHTWEYCGSDTEDSGIYLGEINNRLLREDPENKNRPVTVLRPAADTPGISHLVKEHLTDRYSLPVLAMEEISVKKVIHTPAGETVLDMGQNFAGFIEFQADLPRGTRVILDFGEILQQGNFYNQNYRDAESRFVYISNGTKEKVRPHFTFFGFRYVKVSGWQGNLKPEHFTGKVLYSDITRTGFIETADKKINRLYENTLWGLKSNFLDIPTDCPQRSERLGWTGDAQVFAATASYHMDTRAFYHKFIQDLKDEQEYLDGGVPNTFPNIGHKDDVSSVWGDVAAILPETVYRYYGNLQELSFAYPLTRGWVDYITRKDIERGQKYLYDFGMSFGDWLALDGATPNSFAGSTDNGYIGSVYYYNSVSILSKMAARLGLVEDERTYRELAENIRQEILREYFSETGRLAVNTQAAYVIALKFGVYKDKKKIIEGLKLRLKLDCHQIKCGFVGAPLLCSVLAENDLVELAYDFLLKEGFPSWLYSVNLGATTIWERWNSVLPDGTISDTGMNSLNHYAYGSVMEFMYAYVAGIRPLEPGFSKAVIEPHPDIRLPYVNCRYDSVSGQYVCNWAICDDGTLQVHLEIPFQCEAQVRLPQYQQEELLLKAGSYDFSYLPRMDFRKPYHMDTTLFRLSQDQEVMKILAQYTPPLAGMAKGKDVELAAKTLADIRTMTYLPIDPQQLTKAIDEICSLTVALNVRS